MTELGIREAAIVTRNESDRVNTAAGTIAVIPAWRFLLELPDPGI